MKENSISLVKFLFFSFFFLSRIGTERKEKECSQGKSIIKFEPEPKMAQLKKRNLNVKKEFCRHTEESMMKKIPYFVREKERREKEKKNG